MPTQTTFKNGLTITRLQQGEPRSYLPAKSVGWDRLISPVGQGIYTFVVGTLAQVTANVASHSDLQAAIDAASAGDSILILSNYALTGNINLNKTLSIYGMGFGCTLTGTFTITSAHSLVKNLTISGSLVFSAASSNNIVTECWQPVASTVTDSGTNNFYLLQDV